MKIAGIIFPIIILYVFLIFYNKNIKSRLYHMIYVVYSICTVSSLISPIMMSILYKKYEMAPGEDVTDFLYITKMNPSVLTSMFVLLLVINVFILIKSGIINTLIKLKEESV